LLCGEFQLIPSPHVLVQLLCGGQNETCDPHQRCPTHLSVTSHTCQQGDLGAVISDDDDDDDDDENKPV